MCIRELIDSERTVYIVLRDKAAQYRFMGDAEREGITYTNGTKPTEQEAEEIMALHPDGTISFLGWAGRILYHNIKDTAPCVDYGEYICRKQSGLED